jgi:hypothetical protein
MQQSAFIIHGSYGNPDENWFPWLKTELEKIDIKTFVPKFPTPINQTLEEWMQVFKEYRENLNENSIIVGHSIGCAFLLSVLEKIDVRINASFLVSGFLGLLGNDFYDRISSTFTQKEFDWEKIKNNCSNFLIYNSDNDPYVPLEKGKEIAENLNAKLKVINRAGHFNEKSGYTKFELLLEDIKNLAAKDL